MKQLFLILFLSTFFSSNCQTWNSKWLTFNDKNELVYHTDKNDGIIPDFSKVGYLEGQTPPNLEVTIELEPQAGDDRIRIQEAINELATKPIDTNGFRGCLLLKRGIFEVSDEIKISVSGIVIRGEGNTSEGTIVIATGKKQYNLFNFEGVGSMNKIPNTLQKITMNFVPVGTNQISIKDTQNFKKGDKIIVYRPGTENWIADIKMNVIAARKDGREIVQWKAKSYNLHFERKIIAINNNTITLDNPIVMEMEDQYGGGYIYKYSFEGRIKNCGIENLLLKSEYAHDTDENHAKNAVNFNKARDCWVEDVVAKHFVFSAVNISKTARNISVLNCKSLDAKSTLNGGRRYSFSCNGQLNLIKNCESSDARHSFVTGSRVCGPNVFTQCKSKNDYNDIGPHQRWAVGTLYDCIESEGIINVQDRGNRGSGHGWAGATNILWNCTAEKICVQSPWVSAKNYAIGCSGEKYEGMLADRNDGEWEGLNKKGLLPFSLYETQLENRKN